MDLGSFIRCFVLDYLAVGLMGLFDFTNPTTIEMLSDSLNECQGHRLSLGNFAVVLFIYVFVCSKQNKYA